MQASMLGPADKLAWRADLKDTDIEKEIRMVTTFRAVSMGQFWGALDTRLAPLMLEVRVCKYSLDRTAASRVRVTLIFVNSFYLNLLAKSEDDHSKRDGDRPGAVFPVASHLRGGYIYQG
jgi:hypothetical protein